MGIFSRRSKILTLAASIVAWPSTVATLIFVRPGSADDWLAIPLVVGMLLSVAAIASVVRENRSRP